MIAVSMKTRPSMSEVRMFPAASGWRAMLSADFEMERPIDTAPAAAAMPTAIAAATGVSVADVDPAHIREIVEI